MCRPYWKAEGFMSTYDRRLTYRKTFVFPSEKDASIFYGRMGNRRCIWHSTRITVMVLGDETDYPDKTATDCRGSPAEGDDGTWMQKGV